MSDVAVPSSGTDGSSTLASLNETERAHWQLTGELPEPAASDPPQPDPAESASASPDDQAVSTETHAPPASEPGTPPKTTPKLAKRHEELDAEIASLNEKLATRAKLRAQLSEDDRPIARPPVPDVMPAASSPAPGDVPLDRLLVSPDLTKPPLNDAEFFAAYPEAGVSQLSRYQARYEFLRGQAEMRVQSERQQKYTSYLERRQQALAENPAFMAELDPRVANLTPAELLPPGAQVTIANLIGQEIYESPQAMQVMAYLSDHPEELTRLHTVDPRQLAREMGRIEGKVTAVPANPVVPKTTTSAPAPAVTLGSKPAVPVDETKAAVAAGDFRRYFSAQNRREAS